MRINRRNKKVFGSTVSAEKSWKCCRCNSENYNDPNHCSHCGHDRCGSCKDLLGTN